MDPIVAKTKESFKVLRRVLRPDEHGMEKIFGKKFVNNLIKLFLVA